jgi:formylglycine-generating enzyme
VVNVSWNDAVAFCKWLSRKEGKSYRCRPRPSGNMPAGRARRRGTTTGTNPEGLAAVGNVADATAKAKFPDWDWPIQGTRRLRLRGPGGQVQAERFRALRHARQRL